MEVQFRYSGGVIGIDNMKRKLFYLAVAILVAGSLGACMQNPEAFGILEGHVTVGPLSPVVSEGEAEATPAPEVYAGREVVVFRADGVTEFARVKIDGSGNYQAKLPVGTYVVDINHLGIDTAAGLPAEIWITDQAVTRLDIDIDTGIR